MTPKGSQLPEARQHHLACDFREVLHELRRPERVESSKNCMVPTSLIPWRAKLNTSGIQNTPLRSVLVHTSACDDL
eukprot:5313108-Amphidinium_carterae.1